MSVRSERATSPALAPQSQALSSHTPQAVRLFARATWLTAGLIGECSEAQGFLGCLASPDWPRRFLPASLTRGRTGVEKSGPPVGRRCDGCRNYRYVIVGAGAAGCVLANRLSADPGCRVALLEAGGPDRRREIRIPAASIKLFLTEYDWNYHTTKRPSRTCRIGRVYWPRGRTLGDSSSINAQAWTRGRHRADYDGWAQSCPGWSYDEVLSYFQAAGRAPGWVATLAACRAHRGRSSSPSCATPTQPPRRFWLPAPSLACAGSATSTTRTTPGTRPPR